MRADKFFADKFSSRTKAAEAIERGMILVNGKSLKPSDEVNENDEFEILQPDEYFVSNGGYKLSKALKEFSFDCRGLVFADIGASTGGFTDCLLQNGARKVYCIDVGESLLDKSLVGREEIVQMQNCNARYLKRGDFSENIDGCTIDVSFISLKHILPVAEEILCEGGVVFALIKPQFECEKKNIGKSGIVNRAAHAKIVSDIYDFALEYGLSPQFLTNAPVREKKNVEYVMMMKKGAKATLGRRKISEICKKVK